ncbi:hypothetical protein BDV18DRAFT_133963 [Aspergillus unguis]
MKRSIAPPDRLPSQQPVSCQFCRTRKLKCDRGRPCFNCASRNHECAYESDSQRPSAHPSCTQHSELVERIRRLERAVFPAGGPGENDYTGSDPAMKTVSNQDEEQQKISQWLEDLSTPV